MTPKKEFNEAESVALNNAIKLAKMQPWERERALGLAPLDRGYGEIGQIDTGGEGLGS